MSLAIEYVKGVATTVRKAGSASAGRPNATSRAPAIINAPFFTPLLAAVPGAATAPALVVAVCPVRPPSSTPVEAST
jgi:hypothetical protein